MPRPRPAGPHPAREELQAGEAGAGRGARGREGGLHARQEGQQGQQEQGVEGQQRLEEEEVGERAGAEPAADPLQGVAPGRQGVQPRRQRQPQAVPGLWGRNRAVLRGPTEGPRARAWGGGAARLRDGPRRAQAGLRAGAATPPPGRPPEGRPAGAPTRTQAKRSRAQQGRSPGRRGGPPRGARVSSLRAEAASGWARVGPDSPGPTPRPPRWH